MIKAYIVGISTYQEGEDIEIRYSIFKDGELLEQKKKFQGYRKAFLVTQFALLSLFKELKKYPNEDIKIIMFDSAVNELLRGTSTTKNAEAIRVARKVNEELRRFDKEIEIFDVTGNNDNILDWDKALDF